MPKYAIKNLSQGQRLVQTEGSKGKRALQVSLLPGEERTLSLTPIQAQRYTQAAASNEKYLRITPLDDQSRSALSGQDTEGAPEEASSGAPSGPTAAQELLGRADGMPVEDLRTEARMVLSSSWPRRGGGDLTRDQIKELLSK
jgi:hypothetical protein